MAGVIEPFDGFSERLTESLGQARNATVIVQADNGVDFGKPLDVAIMNNLDHDLRWQNVVVAAFSPAIRSQIDWLMLKFQRPL